MNNTTDADTVGTLELIIASLVADGMSRTGFRSIGSALENLTDPLELLPDDPSSSWKGLMRGTHSFPRPEGPATELKWSVTVTGYAYQANNRAYRLALAVLFLHAVLAIAHIVYVVCTRVFCDAWDSITELIVLAAMSTEDACTAIRKNEDRPSSDSGSGTWKPHVFDNASSGITRYKTMNAEVRIRAKDVGTLDAAAAPRADTDDHGATAETDQQVMMLFGHEDTDSLEETGYRELEIGKAYG